MLLPVNTTIKVIICHQFALKEQLKKWGMGNGNWQLRGEWKVPSLWALVGSRLAIW